MFIVRIRFRLFVLASIGALFNYWGNLLGLGTSKVERSFKKYKKRWIFRNNPHLIVYDTAIETTFQPTKISR